ncbi:hypothetical protein [Microbacterium karelineae]|uniref:hypothetical protein n=1 Tax=Microbacterium karelineae TaxID=2654283 RepID=UPI0012EAB1D0|nr:hypothetical protein [Microbacterium karelineae]
MASIASAWGAPASPAGDTETKDDENVQEIERAYLRAQPDRFIRVASRRKRTGFLIAAGVFLVVALGVAVGAPAMWAHFSGQAQAGYESVRPFRGSGMAFFGIMIVGAMCLILGVICAWLAATKAADWIDSRTGNRLRTGRVARFPDAAAFERIAREMYAGTLAEIPEIRDQAGSGKMILQTMEDREAQRVHVWLESSDGRTASAELHGAAWGRLATHRTV